MWRLPSKQLPGTAVSMNFLTDKAQSCLYIGDNTNMTIYILGRDNLHYPTAAGILMRTGLQCSSMSIGLIPPRSLDDGPESIGRGPSFRLPYLGTAATVGFRGNAVVGESCFVA
jgi:hypothetical protein